MERDQASPGAKDAHEAKFGDQQKTARGEVQSAASFSLACEQTMMFTFWVATQT